MTDPSLGETRGAITVVEEFSLMKSSVARAGVRTQKGGTVSWGLCEASWLGLKCMIGPLQWGFLLE